MVSGNHDQDHEHDRPRPEVTAKIPKHAGYSERGKQEKSKPDAVWHAPRVPYVTEVKQGAAS